MTLRAASPGGRTAAALACGALAVAGFAPAGLAPLAPAALAVLFHLWLTEDSPHRAGLLGWTFGFAHFGTGVSWVYVSLHDFGMMPAPLAVLATVLFCAYLALFPALAGSLQARLPFARHWRLLAVMPALWILSEWLRSVLFCGFPWLALGYSQVDTPLSGFAPLLGLYGVSFAAAAAAGLTALLAERRGRTAALLAIALLLLCGQGLKSVQWTVPAGEPLRVALIQGNIPLSVKFDPGRFAATLDTYRRLALSSNARLQVFPETALPRFLDLVDPRYLEDMARHARGLRGDVLLGVPLRDRDGRYYNSVISLGDSPAQSYSKSHLVPLGEFVPPEFGWILRVLKIPLSDFTPGTTHPEPLSVAGERVAVNVCYEDAFGGEIIRQLPQATLLVNVSNVAWFGDSLAPEQHLQISRMRAVETGRTMLRATNSGVTAIIGPGGEVDAKLPEFVEGVLEGTVRGYRGATPYVRLGDTPVLLLAAATLALAFLLRGKSRS